MNTPPTPPICDLMTILEHQLPQWGLAQGITPQDVRAAVRTWKKQNGLDSVPACGAHP